MKLEISELMMIKGGAFKGIKYAIFAGIGGIITLIIGIIDGYMNPQRCN